MMWASAEVEEEGVEGTWAAEKAKALAEAEAWASDSRQAR
jgi:hypothetical protein